jgi:tetratricopeptide (TPR) repeat protein
MVQIKIIVCILFLFLSFIDYGRAQTNRDYSKQVDDSSDYYTEQGGLYFNKSDFENAAKSFSKSLIFNEKNTQALLFRGWSYIYLREYEKTIEDANKIYQIDSLAIPDLYKILGIAKMYLGKPREAIVNYNTFIKLKPSSGEGYQLRAQAYDELKEYNKVIDDYTGAIKFSIRNTEKAEMYYCRGNGYIEILKLNEAYSDYLKATQIDPQCANAYRGLAIVNKINKNYEAALYEIKQAIQLKAELINYSTKINILFDMGDIDACLEGCNLYLQIDNSNAQIYMLRARCIIYNNSEYIEGLTDLDKAIAIDPNNYQPYYLKGSIYLFQNQYNSAINAFAKALLLNKKDAYSYAGRGLSYLKLKDTVSAQSNMLSAVKLDSLNPDIIELRGEFYLEMGKYAQASKDFKYVLKKDPLRLSCYINNSKALLNLGKFKEGLDNINAYLSKDGELVAEIKLNRALLYLSLDSLSKAESDFDDLILIKFEPNVTYLYSGICYYRSGFYSKALWSLQQAGKSGADGPLLYETKGQVFMSLHDYKSAVIEFSKLVKEQPQNGNAYLDCAESRMEMKDYLGAIKDLTSAVNLITDKSRIIPASNLLAFAYVYTDNLDEALRVLTNTPLYTSENKIQVSLMKIVILTGKLEYQKALNECNDALRIESNNPVLLRYKGLLHMMLQNYNSAIDDFLKLVELYPDAPDAYMVLKSDVNIDKSIPYKYSVINNLALYKDTTTNTITIGLMLDTEYKEKLLNNLIEVLNARTKLKNKKSSCYLLSAEFRKVLSTNTIETLNDYNKAIAEYTHTGVSFYLRGLFERDFLKNKEQGCADITKSKSLGIKTDECK